MRSSSKLTIGTKAMSTAMATSLVVAASLMASPTPSATAVTHEPRIVFMREGFSDDTRILVSNSAGTWTKPLTLSHRFARGAPRWRPDGRRILFTRANVNGDADTDLMLMKPHGHDKQLLMSGQHRYFIDDMAWAPDGRRVVLAMWDSQGGGDTDLWIYTLASGELEQLHATHFPERVVESVDWSPEGTIMFSAYDYSDNADEDTDLFTVQPDGSNLQQLTDTPRRSESSPRFSPDGQRLVYFAVVDRCRYLVVANADGTNRQRARAGCNVGFTGASWSPDSRRLLVELMDGGPSEIWAMSVDGVHKRFVTRGEYASWRPGTNTA